jgi:RNA polymerase-binding transcription factor DksA
MALIRFIGFRNSRPQPGTWGKAKYPPSEKNMLTNKQLAHIEARLQEERARAQKALGLFDEMAKADRESGDSALSAYTDHMADQGTEAMEREKAALFATKEGRYLYRLEEALRRLYNDPTNFGKCHTCGAEVGYERLDALPHARYCIDCKVKEEEEAA